MGDSLKLSKDKRHRSSSSLAGAGLEGTRSERKLDIRALIPEIEDHFALAESRCDDLQEKIDTVKVFKRKKKLNKRSMTRVNEQPAVTENVPYITVRTQPKKKASQAARLRQLEVPPNPTRGYLDPATVEQHRMLGQVWGYGQNYNQNQPEQKQYTKTRPRRNRADGDGMGGRSGEFTEAPTEVACGQDEEMTAFSGTEIYDQSLQELESIQQNETAKTQWPRKKNHKEVPKWIDASIENTQPQYRRVGSPLARRRPQQQKTSRRSVPSVSAEERPVVELFSKSRASYPPTPDQTTTRATKKDSKGMRKARDHLSEVIDLTRNDSVMPQELTKRNSSLRRSRGYEMPTVASQMKQAEARLPAMVSNGTNIPFVVSKSTAPSHNIGVNIQQVLNGVKVHQSLNSIPPTIAHHMGLEHVPTPSEKNKPMNPLNNREINAVRLGQHVLRLTSNKNMSYGRLLSYYREGDGMVPRFLRAISRPNYFYTSAYNLAFNRDDRDGATSKGRAGVDDFTKEKLLEYANIYREYEAVDRQVKEGGHPPELERHREDLLRELTEREELIRKVLTSVSGMTGQTTADGIANLRATILSEQMLNGGQAA